MARIRTVKPEFWRHEMLSALPEATHMLAAALLNYSDDYGYFNANPKLVQAECCPLREPSVTIPESLRSLQEIGYIRLGGTPDGRRYGHVVEFEKHQKVSHATDSKISCLSITWEISGNAPEPLVSPPETFRPEQGTGNREQGTGNREQGKTRARGSAAHDCEQAVAAWNALAEETGLSAVQRMNPKRQNALRLRLAECGGIDGWHVALGKVRDSPFLRGQNNSGWCASFDFMLQQSSFTKVLEGGYERARNGSGKTVHGSDADTARRRAGITSGILDLLDTGARGDDPAADDRGGDG